MFLLEGSGTKYALIGKKLMFAKNAASALLEARIAVEFLVAGEEAIPGQGGFAINVEAMTIYFSLLAVATPCQPLTNR